MIAKMGSSVSTFRQQHPRYFIASLCTGALFVLFMLAGPTEGGFKDRYLGYTYPPPVSSAYIKDDGYPALGPRDITAAVRRSEQIWLENKKKREAFIKEKGGLEGMRMFSDKAWVGYGQMFTLW
jgi:hypothetical protein